MPLPIDFIERLKAANPIAEVMSSYVTLKRTGRDYVCLCPFHNEKTPSCHIHPDKEYFHCFGCGAGGDVITFTMKYNNLDYWEAVKLLAERGGVPLPEDNGYDSKRTDTRKRFYEMNKTAARFFYHQLKTPQGKECLDYLINKRKLSIETIKKYGMGFAPNSWSALKSYMLSEGFTEEELEQGSLISRSQKNTRNTFDFFVNRAMFPFIDLAGHIVGFGGRALTPDDKRKYLNSKDTLVYSKNRFLFSMNFAKNAAVKDKTILLCEGNLDVISLNQAGFENAVASCGTALTPEQAKIISNYADIVPGGKGRMTRREMREHCFKMLFGVDFYPAEEKEEQLERYFEAPKEDVTGEDGKDEILHDPFEKEEDRAYLEKRVEKIMELIPEIDEKINEIAEGWRTRRMGKVELTILRLAVFEMKYDEEIPEKVAINEAVELAKKFGGDEAPAFVNGILAKLIQKGN